VTNSASSPAAFTSRTNSKNRRCPVGSPKPLKLTTDAPQRVEQSGEQDVAGVAHTASDEGDRGDVGRHRAGGDGRLDPQPEGGPHAKKRGHHRSSRKAESPFWT